MKFTAYVESDSFQIGLLAAGPLPYWTEDTLDAGITNLETGILVATHPDLDHRKLSIPITVMDNEDDLSEEQAEKYVPLGTYEILSHKGVIDVGCIPSICEGTSGRLRVDKEQFHISVYGDLPREPHKLIVKFTDAKIISVDANRLMP